MQRIAREMKKIKEIGIPVYVRVKNTAASGGYYVSAGAIKIFATDETVDRFYRSYYVWIELFRFIG